MTMHLPPEWRGNARLQNILEDDFVRHAEALKAKQGAQLATMDRQIQLAKMRLETEDADPVEAADGRLAWWFYGVPTLAVIPQSLALIHDFLIQCVDAGFAVGYESGKGRWVPKRPERASFWTRLFRPRKAFAEKAADAWLTLTVDLARSRPAIIEDLDADPPWRVESRLSLIVASTTWGVSTVDWQVRRAVPREEHLILAANDMVNKELVVGIALARGQWPPKSARGAELQRLRDRLKHRDERAKATGRRRGLL